MSFRAVFIRVKQIATDVLRRRVLFKTNPNGKLHDQALGRGGTVESHLLTVEIARPVPGRLQRVFLGNQSGPSGSLAATLRRNAALRLIYSRFASTRTRRYGFGLTLGLTLAARERSSLEENRQEGCDNEHFRRLPLETCCKQVREIFTNHHLNSHLEQPIRNFPSEISSYDISSRLLGKGACASIYAARLRAASQAVDVVVDEETDENAEDDETSSQEDCEMVSDDEEDAILDAGFFEVPSASPDAILKSEDEVDAEMEDVSTEHPVRNSDDGYDLALKMMFNYDVASNDIAIRRAFDSECLPLHTSLVKEGYFGENRWENGHRAKKKGVLPPHPNIVTIHHAFVAQTTVHDLDEAQTLFPAALPARLYNDGLGRNQTMFLVMKRYDMTLAEYNKFIGCPSQHVAMVIIAQLLEGVAHLVHHGIAHRDLKSNNVLVELTAGSPLVVISDFGCCLADHDLGLHLPYQSRHTAIGGNSALMAPEVKTCKPGPNVHIDYTKSDAWAVGAICYEILGLSNPFYRHDDGSYGLDSATYAETDLPELPEHVNTGLGRVAGLLLKRDPAERPTATVAANMLHLLLLQPSVSHWSSWECSKLIPIRLARQQLVTTWVLRMTAGMLLCQRPVTGHVTVEGQRSWLDGTEYQLCMTFMSRLTSDDLLKATNQLLS